MLCLPQLCLRRHCDARQVGSVVFNQFTSLPFLHLSQPLTTQLFILKDCISLQHEISRLHFPFQRGVSDEEVRNRDYSLHGTPNPTQPGGFSKNHRRDIWVLQPWKPLEQQNYVAFPNVHTFVTPPLRMPDLIDSKAHFFPPHCNISGIWMCLPFASMSYHLISRDFFFFFPSGR